MVKIETNDKNLCNQEINIKQIKNLPIYDKKPFLLKLKHNGY